MSFGCVNWQLVANTFTISNLQADDNNNNTFSQVCKKYLYLRRKKWPSFPILLFVFTLTFFSDIVKVRGENVSRPQNAHLYLRKPINAALCLTCDLYILFSVYFFSYVFIYLRNCHIHNIEECSALNQQLQHFTASANTAKLKKSDKTDKIKQPPPWFRFQDTDSFICVLHFLWLAVRKSNLYLTTAHAVLKVKCSFWSLNCAESY